MLRSELKGITFKYMDENKQFKEEYDTIVTMLKSVAEDGRTSLRVKDISPCVLKKLHNEGIRWNTVQGLDTMIYDLTWM